MTAYVDDRRVRTGANWLAALLGFYWVIHRFWPAPFAILCKGAIVGGLYALMALGIALIYRANRIINFAQADMGGVGASLAVMLIVSSGWAYAFAIPTGLVVGVVTGVVVEFVIVRRFAKAPRLILTVVTIGIGSLLGVGEIALPLAFGLKVPPQNFPSPFNFAFHFQRVVFRGNDLLAAAMVPIVLATLAWFLNRTDFGVAVRACSESSDRASLLGVPVKRVNTLVWAVAALLSTVALILRAGVVGLPVGSAIGVSLLLPTLGAAVLGRMEKMPTIVVGAVAFGVVEQAVVWHTGSADIVDLVSFLVIAGALFLQRRGVAGRTAALSSWTSVREVRPIPPELVKLPEVVWARRALVGVVIVIALCVPALVGDAKTDLAVQLIVSMIVGLSLLVLVGWTGQISLGQFAFVGVGAVTGAWMSLHWHLDLSLELLVAGLIGAVVAAVIGVPALRIPGLFLSVMTFAFAKASSSYFLKYTHFSWIPQQDQRMDRNALFGRVMIDSEQRYYFFALAVLVVCIFAVRGLRASRFGRAVVAVRDNERGAQAYGVSVMRVKLTAFAFSGFFAAVGGVIVLHLQQALYPGTVSPLQSITAFTTAVFGGLGSMTGVFTGALYLNGLSWIQTSVPASIQPFLQLMGSGLGLIIVLMFLPDGVGSLVFRLRDNLLRRLADRRGIVVPSLVADVRQAAVDDEPDIVAVAEDEFVGAAS
ncbi:MAG TPA: ABC transporter permease [Acidimicrobiales bacterium]|nr:ABC transporter permease [Acidimicrobiales bacterium]